MNFFLQNLLFIYFFFTNNIKIFNKLQINYSLFFFNYVRIVNYYR